MHHNPLNHDQLHQFLPTFIEADGLVPPIKQRAANKGLQCLDSPTERGRGEGQFFSCRLDRSKTGHLNKGLNGSKGGKAAHARRLGCDCKNCNRDFSFRTCTKTCCGAFRSCLSGILSYTNFHRPVPRGWPFFRLAQMCAALAAHQVHFAPAA